MNKGKTAGGQYGMENQKAVENQQEDKRAFTKFIIIIAAACLVGGAVGYVSAGTSGGYARLAELVLHILNMISPYAIIVLTTADLIAGLITERQCRRAYAGWDEEDEAALTRIEMKLGYAMIANTMSLVMTYFFLGAGFYSIDFDKIRQPYSLTKALILLAGVAYALIITTRLQKQLVNLEKEINPEKRGSAYDPGFADKWLGSCDEAERFQIYKASYKAYKMTNSACIVLWVISVIGILAWDFGLMPMTMVILLWAVLHIGYFRESIRLTRHPEEIMK